MWFGAAVCWGILAIIDGQVKTHRTIRSGLGTLHSELRRAALPAESA